MVAIGWVFRVSGRCYSLLPFPGAPRFSAHTTGSSVCTPRSPIMPEPKIPPAAPGTGMIRGMIRTFRRRPQPQIPIEGIGRRRCFFRARTQGRTPVGMPPRIVTEIAPGHHFAYLADSACRNPLTHLPRIPTRVSLDAPSGYILPLFWQIRQDCAIRRS